MHEDMFPLIELHMPLAQQLAQQVYRKAPHALELDELGGIAYYGLVDAAAKWHAYCERNSYDPGAVQFFRPYVVRRVKGSLIDAIRAADWATRSLRTRAKAIQEVITAAGRGISLTDQELADRTGMTVKDIRSTMRGMAMRPVSLEAEEIDPETGTSVESSAFIKQVLYKVVDIVRGLQPEHQVVLTLVYFDGMQLQQAAKAMGIPDSRASQVHAEAVLAVHAVMLAAAEQEATPDAV